MIKIIKSNWYLPVKQSRVTGDYYISDKAKYHYFKNDTSLCNKYWQVTDNFETNNITDGEVLKDNTYVCKICYKKWLRLRRLKQGESYG